MNLQPILQDELLLLRPLLVDDYNPLYAVAHDHLIWEQHQIKDRFKQEIYKKFFNDSMASGGALIVIDKKRDEIIGSSRFKPLENVDYAVEIGWSFLARKYWGGLFNRSMKTLMINHAFGFFTDIIFYIDENNIRSQKAVEKIGGLRIKGPLWKHLIKDSSIDLTYRIIKEDWNEIKKNRE